MPHIALRTVSEPVTVFDDVLRQMIAQMAQVLAQASDPIGVGLAANQVNVLKRIFVMHIDSAAPTQVFINPQIMKRQKKDIQQTISDKDDEPLEGCLSVPRIWAPIDRDWKIRLRWHDEYQKQHEQDFEGFQAAVIQHEIDHLDGMLFTQRAMEQGKPIYEERGGKLHEVILP